jgi:hypothetical protein
MSAKVPTFVTHDELVRGLLGDPIGRQAVDAARRTGGDAGWSREQWASNMVQWFSQRVTARTSPYRDRYEREKQNRKWAYRPR